MPEVQAGAPPSPQLFFETVTAFHKTEALKAAIQLEIFTAIGEGNQTAAAHRPPLPGCGTGHAHPV